MLKRIIRSAIQEGLIFMIYFYQVCISPLFLSPCRFTPTCSQFTMDAISAHGPLKGVCLGIKRILRCQPFFPGGYDPVERKG